MIVTPRKCININSIFHSGSVYQSFLLCSSHPRLFVWHFTQVVLKMSAI